MKHGIKFLTNTLIAMAMSASLTTQAIAALYATGVNTSGIGGNSALYTVDPVTGASSLAWSLAGGVNIYNGGLAYDAAADTLYATGFDNLSVNKLFTINRFTGATTTIGGPGGNIDFSSGGLAINPLTGVMYATGTNGTQGSQLYTIDKTTGAATLVGTNGIGGAPNYGCACLYGLGFRNDGVLFANGFAEPLVQTSDLFTVNLTTGAATYIGSNGVTLGRKLIYSGLAFNDNGTLLSLGSIAAATSGLYSVNTANGAAALLGGTGLQFGVDGGLAFAPAAVPVPAAVWLFGSGLLGLIGVARRKTHTQ